jgi:hypothetical protein
MASIRMEIRFPSNHINDEIETGPLPSPLSPYIPSISFRNTPVAFPSTAATSSGVPVAVIVPSASLLFGQDTDPKQIEALQAALRNLQVLHENE